MRKIRIFEIKKFENDEEEGKKLRIWAVFWVFVGLLFLIALRLFYIQVIGLEYVQGAFLTQHSSSLWGLNYRGDILDRNGQLLVNQEEIYLILIDKTKYNEKAQQYLNRLSAEKISVDNRRYHGFKTKAYDKEVMEAIKNEFGGFVFMGTDRYSDSQPAAHIIGYCNYSENKGTFGLEKAFDDMLNSDGTLSFTVDGVGRIIPGQGLKYNEDKIGESIHVTLDRDIQRMTEKVIEESDQSGAAVVIVDAKNGGILASVSYPFIDPENIQEAKGNSLVNKVLQSSYPPGSLFKIIVAAAAIEEGAVELEDKFHCSGEEDLFGVKIGCSKEEGHGDLTFEESFAKSCNSAFIQLGRKLGSEKILEMAARFGVGKKVLGFLEEETPGNLPDKSQTSGAGIGNLSIGQGELEITCIQAARITGIIACGGKDPGIHLTTESDVKGDKLAGGVKRIISTRTALLVKKLMEGVVENGTGRRAGEDSAGKSGSAQSNIGGKAVVHGWYTGFFPVRNPEYIITVFTQGSGGAHDSVSIFAEIHEALLKTNNK